MTKSIQVLIIADGIGPSAARGVEIVFENLKVLSSLGTKITLLTTIDSFTDIKQWEKWRSREEKEAGVKIHAVDWSRFSKKYFVVWFSKILTFIKAVQLLKKNEFDIVHEYSSTPLMALRIKLLSLLGRCKGAQTVITANTSFWAKPFWGISSSFLDKIIFTSRVYAKKYERFIREKKIKVIPVGVDLDCFGLSRQKEDFLGLPKNRKIFLYLGPPEKEKGVFLFSKAVSRVLTQNKKALFLFVFYRKMSPKIYASGVQRTKKTLEEHVPNVRIVESVVDVPKLLSSVDVIVTPQLTPHGTFVHPQTILEAMAAGKVIVAPRTPEISELIVDDKTGFMFEEGNLISLYNALNKALRASKNVGISARKLIIEKYDLKQNARKLFRLYQELVR